MGLIILLLIFLILHVLLGFVIYKIIDGIIEGHKITEAIEKSDRPVGISYPIGCTGTSSDHDFYDNLITSYANSIDF